MTSTDSGWASPIEREQDEHLSTWLGSLAAANVEEQTLNLGVDEAFVEDVRSGDRKEKKSHASSLHIPRSISGDNDGSCKSAGASARRASAEPAHHRHMRYDGYGDEQEVYRPSVATSTDSGWASPIEREQDEHLSTWLGSLAAANVEEQTLNLGVDEAFVEDVRSGDRKEKKSRASSLHIPRSISGDNDGSCKSAGASARRASAEAAHHEQMEELLNRPSWLRSVRLSFVHSEAGGSTRDSSPCRSAVGSEADETFTYLQAAVLLNSCMSLQEIGEAILTDILPHTLQCDAASCHIHQNHQMLCWLPTAGKGWQGTWTDAAWVGSSLSNGPQHIDVKGVVAEQPSLIPSEHFEDMAQIVAFSLPYVSSPEMAITFTCFYHDQVSEVAPLGGQLLEVIQQAISRGEQWEKVRKSDLETSNPAVKDIMQMCRIMAAGHDTSMLDIFSWVRQPIRLAMRASGLMLYETHPDDQSLLAPCERLENGTACTYELGHPHIIEFGIGVVGKCAAKKKTLSMSVMHEGIKEDDEGIKTDDEDEDEGEGIRGMKVVLCVPLIFGGEVHGVLVASKDAMEKAEWSAGFNDADRKLLEQIGKVLAQVAHQRDEAIELEISETCKKVKYMQQLLSVTMQHSENIDNDSTHLLTEAACKMQEMLSSQAADVFLLDQESNQLYSAISEARIPMQEGISGAAFESGEAINVTDTKFDPRFCLEADGFDGVPLVKSLLCVPLFGMTGEAIGVCRFCNKQDTLGHFTNADLMMAESFATVIASAIEKNTLVCQMVEMSRYLQSVLQGISEHIVTLDAQGSLVATNRNTFDAWGIDEETMRSTPYYEWLLPHNPILVQDIEQVLQQGRLLERIDAKFINHSTEEELQYNYTIQPLMTHSAEPSGLLLVVQDVSNEKKVMATLSRYMSSSLVEQVLNTEGGAMLGGTSQQVSVLFSDIRGFTSKSENMDARHVMDFLNRFFQPMVELIEANHGVLDKYIGDALMAVFGVPFASDFDALHSCHCALSMVDRLKELNAAGTLLEGSEVLIGIAINTGTAISGNLGSSRRMEFTVIGDAVNIASRLEGVTKHYGVTIILGEDTQATLPPNEFVTRELDVIRVTGKKRSVRIFELVGYASVQSEEMLENIAAFEAALCLYRSAEFEAALEAFKTLQLKWQDDQPTALFVERCQGFIEEGPGKDWDQTYNMANK